MKIKIKATSFNLTPVISDYIKKRVEMLGRLIAEGESEALVEVEVGKTTGHHKKGDVYKAEINASLREGRFRAVSEQEDLYFAIDDAKEEIERAIISRKGKMRTLFRRGGTVIKDIIKGFGKFKWKRFPKLPRFPRFKK